MRSALLALVVFLSPIASAAATIESQSQAVEAVWRNTGGPLDPLSSGDGKTGSETAGTNLTSGKCYDPACTILGGFMAADGSSYAGLEVAWADGNVKGVSSARFEARQRLTIFNDNPVYAEDLVFNYELKDILLELMAGSGGPERDSNPFDGPSAAVGVQLGYEVRSGGFTLARHSFTLWGGANPGAQEPFFDWQVEGGLSAIQTRIDCYEGICDGRSFAIDPVNGSVSLGRLGAGLYRDVDILMWVGATGEHREWDGRARIGDPNRLSATSLTATPVLPPAVPLPGGAPLLAGAALLLLGVRRLR